METIDCTPTWEGLLPMLLELAEAKNVQKNKREETRRYIRAEFRRMAQAADKWNAYVKECEAKEEPMTTEDHDFREGYAYPAHETWPDEPENDQWKEDDGLIP